MMYSTPHPYNFWPTFKIFVQKIQFWFYILHLAIVVLSKYSKNPKKHVYCVKP